MKPTNKQIVSALKKSITHWEKDILANLQAGDSIVTDINNNLKWKISRRLVRCYSNHCALCNLFTDNLDCDLCPLKHCDNSDKSAWGLFMRHRDLMGAKYMIMTLKKHLKRYEKKLKRR